MATKKQRKGFDRAGAPAGGRVGATGRGSAGRATGNAVRKGQRRTIGMIAGAIVVAAIALGGAFLAMQPSGSAGSSSTANAGTLVQSSNGTWTNITPDTLANELNTHDFTLLNVKTPYIGEIDGTDLYIPYTDIAARASELPADKSAKIVVYCRSGAESAIASQELLDLGYTNIQNLDGGMNAWTASGRSLVQKNRS
jgi:phage shock protein E